ncbi:hypothetical protein FB567DRAFT_634188 [Paraphoma chrysanthemicola]|uniref:DUF7730 domain-containing protein n=1 Tax=Paraphoma chrysanthemicola TaxID=798071 RepID=A0A8K0QSY1_9PLEO|nr:hypothetical protein FB567DRAFT_634188 [Paraphoma chrysanthemicola]
MADNVSNYATSTYAVQALNEQRSPLLRIPIEIRMQIYSYVFDSVVIDVAVDNTGYRKYKTYFHPHSKGRLSHHNTKVLSLPRTCRKIAIESRFLLLQHATFHIKNSLPFERHLNDLYPAQRNAIKAIHLHRAVATNLGANHFKAVSDATSLLEIWMVPH